MKNIQYQPSNLERFIPISLEKLILDLLNTSDLNSKDKELFIQFYTRYIAVFHAHSHTDLQYLKSLYHPFNPDKELIVNETSNAKQSSKNLKKELYTVLDNANFEEISTKELISSLNKTSPYGVKVSVDFEEFSDVRLFFRGASIKTESHRNWKRLKFKKQAVDIQVYRRLFVFLQPRNRNDWVEHLVKNNKLSLKKAEKKVDKSLHELGISGSKNIIYLKLFKDIPKDDLEMLFPNTRVQIRLFDKIKLGLMGGSGTAGGIMATITKFTAAIDPVSALIAVGGLLGVIWRQISKVFSQRAKYSAILTKNLYFYSIDNNMGALTYLADSAEAEECKEAILAYFFLLLKGKITQDELDKTIENYIGKQYNIPMDFEITDGLDKLQKANLLSRDNENISAVSLEQANSNLKIQWNEILTNTIQFDEI
ncbi:MAG: DUF3754 domain-containing protein [Methyloprofundus sp.]|nr:DUF3754 domain-containing protein [Methyloprofundus sp.]